MKGLTQQVTPGQKCKIQAKTFQELHKKYRNRLLHTMIGITRNMEEAEDLTAQAFAAAFEHFHGFRGESDFYTWLYRIALNLTKRPSRKPAVSLDAMEGLLPESLIERDLLVQKLSRSECCERVRRTLRRVPAVYRRVLADRFIDGLSSLQVARKHRVPLGTVLSRVFKAKQYLREAWEVPA